MLFAQFTHGPHLTITFKNRLQLTRLHVGQNPGKVQYKRSQIIILGCILIFLESLSLQINIMDYVVPWDGAYRLQNVGYPEQNIGLNTYGVIEVVGCRVNSSSPYMTALPWEVKADSVGERSKITIKYNDHYIGAESKRVTSDSTTPYEWELSYREVGRWAIQDSASGAYLYMPDGAEGTRVTLLYEPIGDMGYWRFVPIRPPSN